MTTSRPYFSSPETRLCSHASGIISAPLVASIRSISPTSPRGWSDGTMTSNGAGSLEKSEPAADKQWWRRRRKPVARTDLERKADQLRSQIETLRQSMDDVLSSYNRLIGVGADAVAQAQRPVTSMAQQVRSNVADVADSVPTVGGFSWWIPVALVGAIGAGIWAFNHFFPREVDNLGDQFSQTANQMGGPVSQAADQFQSQFAQGNPTRDQFSGYQSGGSGSFGQSETTFGEQR